MRNTKVKRIVEAFSPGGLSSFFEICDTKDGKPIIQSERIGARGGGFVIDKGVSTRVEVEQANTNIVNVWINGKLTPEAETSRTVADVLLSKKSGKYDVTIKHKIDIPVGAGFGSSAGGALGTALALSKALNLNFTYNQLGRIAHAAEIKCRTGLGTVGPIMLGGCILTIEPGGPGVSIIDRIPLTSNYVVVTGTFGPTATKQVLSSAEKRCEVNRWGKKTLNLIIENPTLENFLLRSLEFAVNTGFMTDNCRRLVQLAEDAGAIGSAQNMVGEAIHAVIEEENAEKVVETFKQVLPKENILKAKIDFQGAKLVEI